MILETDQKTCDKLLEEYTQIIDMNFDVIFDYTDFIEFYANIISVLWHCFNRRDKFVVNSTISFFCVLRNYILENGGKNINEQSALEFFENALYRTKTLIDKKKEPIYLYRCNLEIKAFCEYYNFRVVYIESESEFESIVKRTAKHSGIF